MENEIEVKYTKSFVAFIDVLGFKNIVKRNDIKKLNSYFNIIRECLHSISSSKMDTKIGSIVISDSIIITVEAMNEDDMNLLQFKNFLLAINFIQYKLALEDIWVRGAITYGDTFYDNNNNQIVGPAYIDAYLLEEQKAIYPRIIIDPKVINVFNCTNANSFIKILNQHDYEKNICLAFDWNCGDGTRINNIEQDVPLFLDYFSLIYVESPEISMKLVDHISKNIYSDISIYVKFKWIVKYLKAVVIKANKKDISIPVDLIDILETF